jgi:hypothetical protein
MNRSVLLIAFAALMAAGLVVVALDPGAGEREAPESEVTGVHEQAPRPESVDGPGESLAIIAKEREFSPIIDEGPARSWEVIALNEVGQPLPEARITATRTGTAMEAIGRYRWETVDSGPWTVEVEVEGLPTWRREVILESNKRTRTVARLGESIRITGTLVDELGTKVAGQPVFFLPPGVGHPTSRDLVRDESNPRAPAQPRNGAVAAELLPGGRIKARLPSDGAWRVSVGRPGDARWTEEVAQQLTHGGQEKVEITVPALGQVHMEFAQEGEERPRQVSVHVFDPQHAAAVLRSRQRGVSDYVPDEAVLEKSGDEITPEQVRQRMQAKQAAKEVATARGTVKPIKMEMNSSVKEVREMAGKNPARTPAFEPGWRMVKSARPDPNGVAKLTELPLGTQMRFLFVRGKEQITTASAFQLRDCQPRLGIPSLPGLGTTPSTGPDNRATVVLQPSPVETRPPAETGARWTF